MQCLLARRSARHLPLRSYCSTPLVKEFQKKVRALIPPSQLSSDPLRLLAYGTDASFYRLIPQLVIHLQSEKDVQNILPLALECKVPVTFRAAGTSLSGQAITDSILLKLQPEHWKKYKIMHEHDKKATHIQVQPGIIGGEVNRLLHRYDKKIGPDPSSIDSCMIGGIVSNNASGMCCGTAKNSYNTVENLRLVFVDGSVLDTGDKNSIQTFSETHPAILEGVVEIRKKILANPDLHAKIARKFNIKCTTGYSLNAFIEYEDPIEIIKHLVIGSEGTLAFISNVTLQTVPEYRHKRTSLIVFPDLTQACTAASVLKQTGSVNAAELMDYASLRSAEALSTQNSGNKDFDRVVAEFNNNVKKLDSNAASLLIEVCSETEQEVEERTRMLLATLKQNSGLFKHVGDISFTKDAMVSKYFWDIRKGLVPLVGGNRPEGSTCLIEDVATEVDKLAPMGSDIKEIFQKYQYDDATLFGHALDGNFHLLFSQKFINQGDVDQYRWMMDDLCNLVVKKYDGSLKAEHGTGRNVAPFVELEWGKEAYEIMWSLKELFDPKSILNPGVILNRNQKVHIENIKPIPVAHPIVDKCIECGFCESNCPSRNLSLTPRQRIVVFREIQRLKKSNEDPVRLKQLEKDYQYDGLETCATDGMCAEKCPVGINTGELVKDLRRAQTSSVEQRISLNIANHYGHVMKAASIMLHATSLAHSIFGASFLRFLSSTGRALTPKGLIPQWNTYFPKAATPSQHILNKYSHIIAPASSASSSHARTRNVVYFSSCVSRLMGPSVGDTYQKSVQEAAFSVLEKANYSVIIPKRLDSLCCGLSFASKGHMDAATMKSNELLDELMEISNSGAIPILCETSPCLLKLRESIRANSCSSAYSSLMFSLYEPVDFISSFLKDKLEWNPVHSHILLHVPCSGKKMKLEAKAEEIVQKCAEKVTHSGVPCCGMAGDRGMRYPELGDSACKPMVRKLEEMRGCNESVPNHGISTSRTCEIQMSNQSDITFSSLFHLVDDATASKRSVLHQE